MIREDENYFAGDLFEEMKEMERTIIGEDVVDGNSTHTALCSPWLTIRCC